MSKPKAVAFVDFEHWYISLDRFYHTRPDMKAWLAELSKTYDVREIFVFADFSNQAIRAEIPKIREVTNYIIETQNASAYITKDFTDFIMLDHIYQKAMSGADLSAFIIFSGDGHFSSVASFLRNQCKKTMVVYGVKRAMSAQLRNTASICVEIPNDDKTEDSRQPYFDMIFGNLRFLEDNNRGQQKLYPTFWGTVDAVAAYYNSNRDDVTDALRYLIERDYIYQTDEQVEPRKTIKVIRVNWELSEREGVYRKSAVQKNAPKTDTIQAQSQLQSPGRVNRDSSRQRQPQRVDDAVEKRTATEKQSVTEKQPAVTKQPNIVKQSANMNDNKNNSQNANRNRPKSVNRTDSEDETKPNNRPQSQPRRQPKPVTVTESVPEPQSAPIAEPTQKSEDNINSQTDKPQEQKRPQPRQKKQYKPRNPSISEIKVENNDTKTDESEKAAESTVKTPEKSDLFAPIDLYGSSDNKKSPAKLSAEDVLKRALEEEKQADAFDGFDEDTADDDKYEAIAEAAGIESDTTANKPKRKRRNRRKKKPADGSSTAGAPEAPD